MTPKDQLIMEKLFDKKLSPLVETVRSHQQTLHDEELGLVVAHKKNTSDIQQLKDGRATVMGISGAMGFITGAVSSFLASFLRMK